MLMLTFAAMRESMRRVAPLLLLPLLTAASKPERIDPLLQVGPLVQSVVAGSSTLEPEGDFFRAVLANSEYDSCLRVERINVRVPNKPRVKTARRYCSVMLGKERLSLDPEEQQEAEISDLSWKEFELSFDLSYVTSGRGASLQDLRCTLDPRDARNTVQCAAR
jgi:hypothetical protein